jgi:hypothetical protein
MPTFSKRISKEGCPFKYLDEFRQYKREARENNRGLLKK